MFFRRFHAPELAIYSYLLGDQTSRRAVCIDPTRDVQRYVEAAKVEGIEIVAILETHVHADFVSGAKELKSLLYDKPLIYASKMGGEAWTPVYADRPVADGDELKLGALRLVARHTPGHTPEHMIWLCYDEARSRDTPWFCFTGDLLFVGGVGRPDLLGDMAMETLSKQLYKSLFETLATLPDFMEILPAHGAGSLCGKGMSDRTSSTLGYERHFNPSLQPMAEDVWLQKLQHQMPAPPQHFKRIKQINVEGPPPWPQRKGPLQQWSKDSFIIDAREPLKYAHAHLPGAVNIPYGSAFCDWASMIVPEERPLVLIVSEPRQALQLERMLFLIGFDQLAGYLVLDKIPAELATVSLLLRSPQQIVEREEHLIIDVRTPAEWDAGHIEGAQHIELARLPTALEQLPKDRPLATICGSGYRSSVAASWLKQAGISDIACIWGGMQAWRQAGLPIEQQSKENL